MFDRSFWQGEKQKTYKDLYHAYKNKPTPLEKFEEMRRRSIARTLWIKNKRETARRKRIAMYRRNLWKMFNATGLDPELFETWRERQGFAPGHVKLSTSDIMDIYNNPKRKRSELEEEEINEDLKRIATVPLPIEMVPLPIEDADF